MRRIVVKHLRLLWNHIQISNQKTLFISLHLVLLLFEGIADEIQGQFRLIGKEVKIKAGLAKRFRSTRQKK
jgi:hypothetical protein